MDQKEARILRVVLGCGCGFGIHNRRIRMVTVFSASESLTGLALLFGIFEVTPPGNKIGAELGVSAMTIHRVLAGR